MDRVRFCSGSSGAITPVEVSHFYFMDPLGAVGVHLLGVCCEAARADFAAAESSPMISAMISSRLFFSVAI